MTVSTEVDHNEYTGNGVTTSFPYTFRIFKKSDLVVQVSDLNGNVTELVLDAGYTVTGAGTYSGGAVVLPSPLAAGWRITIERVLDVVQETDLRNQGKFFPEVHEDAFDYLTMLIQRCFGWFRRALMKPSLLAKYYDAKQNKISNLADPSLEQDAVNNRSMRNYVDTAIAGVVGGFGWFIQYGSGAIYRTFQDKMRDTVSVRDFGAKGDGITDDTSALILAAEYARESSRTLRAEGNFIITETLNLRDISLEMTNAVFTISHSGIGVLLGGNASNPNNPRQNFGTIIRNSGISSETTPDIRIVGAKGQHINIERCDYLQLYANYNASVASTDYSIAYSTFNLKKVDTIHFLGVENGWINENYFYLNRTNNIIFADNPYHHNHNKFYGGTMEGAGKIDIQRGDNNHFYGFRFERYPSSPTNQQLIINFGEYTWNNSIEATWLSSPAYTNEPYNPSPYTYVEVTDNGKGNAVFHIQENISDEVTLFSLNANTPFISSANNGEVGALAYQTDVDGLYNIRHLVSSKFAFMRNFGLLWESGDIPVRNGDMFTFSADAASFRIYLYALDRDGNVITSQTEAITSSMQWDSANHRYATAVNISSIKIRINNEGVPVSAIRLAVYSGGNVVNTAFSWLCLTGRYYKNSWICPYISRHLLSLNPLLACCRRYSRGER
ncbi:hypothetical protein [Escherichia marmotae]|uniref:hypothetical protein n=1 Tax=Escherichia marmotae TaxID=1499973 RepID=UPI0028152A0C|nr:hypothetical protein [Escherichia marmotae]